MTGWTRRQCLTGLLAGTAGWAFGMPRGVRADPPPFTGPALVGRIEYLLTDRETILHEVARRHDLGILEISAANPGIDPWVPGPERLVVLPKAHLLPDAPREGIVVNLAELRLYAFFADGEVVTHAIGIGRDGFETPKGRTEIVRKRKNPTWYPGREARRANPSLPRVVPPGPDNPLGTRALYLGWPSYIIHGTNNPYGVGRRVSLGCIRLYPERIEALYERIPIGTPVTVLEQRIKVAEYAGELWLEVHPDLDQLEELEARYTLTAKPPPAEAYDYIREKAGARAGEVDWYRVDAELVACRGYPVQITNSRGHGPDDRLAARIVSGLY